MRITFLGTSAGESYPAIWCDCPNCTYAREHGGKNIRMNTGSMIDDDILLDMNSCGFYTAARLGVSLTGVRHLICTHAHSDHVTPEPLHWRQEYQNAANLPEEEQHKMISPRFTPLPVMTIYGNRFVRERLVDSQPELFAEDATAQLKFVQIEEGVRVEAENLAFTPVRAQHGEPGFAHSYIIERGGKTLLYALDTSGYDDDMMALILQGRYDGVVMEGTFGLNDLEDCGHLNQAKDIRFRSRLIEAGCISEDTPCFITHMCPHWTPPHDVYAPMMAEKGFIVAYDGLVAEI